jgi:hypothetical protein
MHSVGSTRNLSACQSSIEVYNLFRAPRTIIYSRFLRFALSLRTEQDNSRLAVCLHVGLLDRYVID